MNAHMNACPEDIVLWPCGTWCYREDLYEFTFMSDDFEILKHGTQEYDSFLWAEETMEPEEFREFITN